MALFAFSDLESHLSASIPIFLVLVAVVISVRLHATKTRTGLRDIPGPFLASISSLYRWKRVIDGYAHLVDIDLHRKYGPVVRLGPDCVSISDPTAISKIYSIGSNFPKSEFYPVNQTYSKGKLIPGLFSTTEDDLHRHMKRPIAGYYSMTNVVAYEGLIDKTTTLFISQLDKRYAQSGNKCCFSDWLQFYAFDVMGDVTFSKRLGFLDQGIDVDAMMEKIWRRFKYFSSVGQIPWLDGFWDKSPLLNTLIPAKSSAIVAFAARHTVDRLKSDKHSLSILNSEKTGSDAGRKGDDFLTRFIEAKNRADDIPDWYITAWTVSNMLAGSDTTAIYLRAIFYYLLKNRKSMETLLAEIDAMDMEGKLSPIISWKESQSMPYLEACIKEAGRLHPPIGLPLERVVPSGGVDINGFHIPAGTVIGISAWVVQRDREVFGADADEWRPERWLVDEERKKMDRAMFVFGSGHRSCLGKNIALMELYKLVPQILRSFKIELVNPNEDWIVENRWVAKQRNMDIYVKKRF